MKLLGNPLVALRKMRNEDMTNRTLRNELTQIADGYMHDTRDEGDSIREFRDRYFPADGPPLPWELKPGDTLFRQHDGGFCLEHMGTQRFWPAKVKP